ncbi:MAG: hypothetical protein HY877_04215 [Deltaproteobacteria bacterium]|nr:hypothetical protein [Deltaproteobacteria bacterium]
MTNQILFTLGGVTTDISTLEAGLLELTALPGADATTVETIQGLLGFITPTTDNPFHNQRALHQEILRLARTDPKILSVFMRALSLQTGWHSVSEGIRFAPAPDVLRHLRSGRSAKRVDSRGVPEVTAATSAPRNSGAVIVAQTGSGGGNIALAEPSDKEILAMTDRELLALLRGYEQQYSQRALDHYKFIQLSDRVVRSRALKVLKAFDEIGEDNIIGRGGLTRTKIQRARGVLQRATYRGSAGGMTHVRMFERIVQIEEMIQRPKVVRVLLTDIDLSKEVPEFKGVVNEDAKWALIDREMQSIRQAPFLKKNLENIAGETGKRFFTPEEAMQLAKEYKRVLDLDVERKRLLIERGVVLSVITNTENRNTANFVAGLDKLIRGRSPGYTPPKEAFEGSPPDDFKMLSVEAKWNAVQSRAKTSPLALTPVAKLPCLFCDILRGGHSPTLSGLLTPEEAFAYIVNLERAMTAHDFSFHQFVLRELRRHMEEAANKLRQEQRDRKILEGAPAIRERLAVQLGRLSGPARETADGFLSELDAAIRNQDARTVDSAVYRLDMALGLDKGMPVRLRSGGRRLGDGNKHWKGGS